MGGRIQCGEVEDCLRTLVLWTLVTGTSTEHFATEALGSIVSNSCWVDKRLTCIMTMQNRN